jgi:hypothetical protein
MIRRVLFGATGFVGRNLLRQARFDLEISRVNARELRGADVEELVLCGLPAEKWRANKDPMKDWQNVEIVSDLLSSVRARRVLLISTVDVYAVPFGVDEDSAEFQTQPGYGLNRLRFERFVAEHFPCVTILRLPALFGPGLKKNILFDAIHKNQVHTICLNSVFQWYPLNRLWYDAQIILDAGIDLCNLAVEPLPTREWMTRFFPHLLGECSDEFGASYDMRTKHHALFGGIKGYMIARSVALEAMGHFIREAYP